MAWHGWYDAEPLKVHIEQDGSVRIFMGDLCLHSRQLRPELVSSQPSPGQSSPEALLLLPGAETAPPDARCSWVNERGRGIILITDGTIVVCQLRGRSRGSDTNAAQRHPLAGFWLSIAASIHEDVTIETLGCLSGYSYPTCHAWVRESLRRGTLRESSHAGRQRILKPTQQALPLWWKDIERCWGDWRTPAWPKRHGPGRVQFARFAERLPSLCVDKDRASPRGWPSQAASAGWLWATGADHLAARGDLIQTHDSDVWCSASAWTPLVSKATLLTPPPASDAWQGTRVTLVDEAHPLMRQLWFSAGATHPACEAERDLLQSRERRPGLLAGLPLLDAVGSGDARVAASGQAALAAFTGQLQRRP
jgi:hypothetical protein